MTMDAHWWQRGIIYQIYPRSFQDSNGDGIGDLPGVTSRLGYLQQLGVDALWLSPIFPSPMADFGYDVADYTGIDPIFGTLADFDRLLQEAHARGLKLILDYVPNHTSSRHPWFLASRASRDNPQRDWYIWRDPAPDGGPPNNWLAVFGGSAWTLDEATGQYYYHAFLPEQPDLNWRNPAVKQAMFDALRFWLARGVDGFRVDVIWHLIKDEQFRDNPVNPDPIPGHQYSTLLPLYTSDLPETREVIREMRAVFDEYPDRVMIGEIYLPLPRLVVYYGAAGELVQLPYNFQLITLPWDARQIATAIDEYEALLPHGAWPNWVLGNHDRHRIASRVGPAQARVAAMLLLTLRGTPTIYYGDEIGMHDVAIPPDLVHDPQERNEPGVGLGRDPERTPMQWDAGANAGFSSGTPWLPLADDYRQVNVAAEQEQPDSLLTLHERLIALRRQEPALCLGRYAPLPADGDLLLFMRQPDPDLSRSEGDRFLIALNLGPQPQRLELPASAAQGAIALSTHLDREGEAVVGELTLRPDEGVLVRLAAEDDPHPSSPPGR